MGNVLVFVQHVEGKLLKSTLAAFSAAEELRRCWGKAGIVGVCLGKGAAVAANDALGFGVVQVLFSEDPALERYLASTYAQAVHAAMDRGGCDILVAAATSTTKDLLPRVAVLADAGQASDVIAINADGSLKRPMYAGNVLADVEITTTRKVVTVRATAFAVALKGAASGSVAELALSLDLSRCGKVVAYEISKRERPELADADIVVSGGRALRSAESFQEVLFPLADELKAALGASRQAVDSGYAPNDWQVGQTGKIVAPNLYIAVGISGAIQHLAGMKDSKVIVAINKDPDAPIFEVADYGLVADLFEAVPRLVEEIKKSR